MSNLQQPVVRAAASVAANLLRGAVSFATGLAAARALGAAEYGNFAFLLGSFSALALLLDFGTTSAFYTLLATRPRGRRFFIAYIVWTVGVQFVAVSLAIAFLLPPAALQRIWLGFDRGLILLSLASSFVITQLWMTLVQLAEAVRKTVFIQTVGLAQVVVHLALVIAAIANGMLTLRLLLLLPIVEYGLLALVLAPSLWRANRHTDPDAESWQSVAGEFWTYCRPLVAYSIVGFAYQFADRWFLQRFGGGTQQGYFAIGQQFAAIANLVTASVVAVVWKEVADAFSRKDFGRVRDLFTSVRRAVFFFAAAVSAILLPHSGLLVQVAVGRAYAGATICVGLMFLYPIHQAIGQFQGTFLLATGATTAYSAIGIAAMAISIPLAYMLVASPASTPPGLGWGATGIASKLVVLQVITVTIQYWALRRQHRFEWQFAYEAGVLAFLLGVSFATSIACSRIAAGHEYAAAVSAMLIDAIVFCLLILKRPNVLGLTNDQRDTFLRFVSI